MQLFKILGHMNRTISQFWKGTESVKFDAGNKSNGKGSESEKGFLVCYSSRTIRAGADSTEPVHIQCLVGKFIRVS